MAEQNQRSPLIFGEVPTGALGKMAGDFFGVDLLNPLRGSVVFNREQEEAMAAFNEALAKIPPEMQGAVEEAARASTSFEEFINQIGRMAEEEDFTNPFGEFGQSVQDGFIGPIEAAKEAAFEFSNAREEMFFGMSKGNITGDMVKQVVNKGVETLINTTEVIMTNNFTGMTTTQAANEITKQVVNQLNGLGLNIQQPA